VYILVLALSVTLAFGLLERLRGRNVLQDTGTYPAPLETVLGAKEALLQTKL
jgi:hypothetical protein